jgi:hypothetical protein
MLQGFLGLEGSINGEYSILGADSDLKPGKV